MAEEEKGASKLLAGAGAAVAAAAIAGAVWLASSDGANEYAMLTEEQINAVIDAKYCIDMSLYLPDMSMLDAVEATARVEGAETRVPEVADMEVKAARVSVPEVDAPDVIADYSEDLAEMVALLRDLQSALRDQRSILRDPNIQGGAKTLRRWMKIYSEYESKAAAALPWNGAPGLRVISEARVPRSAEQRGTLAANLAFYKSRGYNGVLVVFDGSESPAELRSLAGSLKSAGLAVWFAFGGKEDLRVSVFPDPDRLKRQIRALAEYSDAWLAGWRRTSGHLLEQDKAYMNYFAACAREANPNIAIIGEAYRGETATHPAAAPGWCLNIPAGASAAALCNFGYCGVAVESVVQKVAPEQTALPLVAVIGGERAYYLTTNPNHLGWEKNQEIKERLEKRFLAAGAAATLTTHDDGHSRFKDREAGSLTELSITELE